MNEADNFHDQKQLLGEQEPGQEFNHFHAKSWHFNSWFCFSVIYWLLVILVGVLITYRENSNDSVLLYNVIMSMVSLLFLLLVFIVIQRNWTQRYPTWARSCVFSSSFLVCIDIFVRVGMSFDQNIYLWANIFFVFCDIFSLLYVSWRFYGWHHNHYKFRILNFLFEWFDLFSQIAVAMIYAQMSTQSSNEVLIVTRVFWSFIGIQLLFWVLPILVGASQNKKRIVLHILLLDIFTDFPLLITTLATNAWKVQVWILIDLIWKFFLMARGFYVGCSFVAETMEQELE